MRHDDKDASEARFRSDDRFFRIDDQWFIATREGDRGPFLSRAEAAVELTRVRRNGFADGALGNG